MKTKDLQQRIDSSFVAEILKVSWRPGTGFVLEDIETGKERIFPTAAHVESYLDDLERDIERALHAFKGGDR